MQVDSIQRNLEDQLGFYQNLLDLAEKKGELLLGPGGPQEAMRLREMVRQETLLVAELEELERARRNLCRGADVEQIELVARENGLDFNRVRQELKSVALKLKDRNQKNQSVLQFSVKLVNRMIQVVRDLSAQEEVTYSRIRRKPGFHQRPGLNFSA